MMVFCWNFSAPFLGWLMNRNMDGYIIGFAKLSIYMGSRSAVYVCVYVIQGAMLQNFMSPVILEWLYKL